MARLRLVIYLVFIVVIFYCLTPVCGHDPGHEHSHHEAHGHGQSHDHDHLHRDAEELPSFKWSREANEAYEDVNAHTEYVNRGRQEEKSTGSYMEDIPQQQCTPKASVWMEALGATVLISIAPYLILFIIPVTNSKEHKPYLKILLAFASGGLLGDAFLHLIPHALIARASITSEHGHSHSHSHSLSHSHFYNTGEDSTNSAYSHGHDTIIGVSVLCGIIVFLIVEKFVRIFKGSHSHSHTSIKHDSFVNEKEAKKKVSEKNSNDNRNTSESKKDVKITTGEGMKVAGYLNLAADFTHNFTDGLAIGASFLAGKSVGIVTTFTIFLHEIPHEIGDFAILLQSGCTKKKAMCLQLVTAVGALSGTWISLLAEGSGDAAVTWILPFTAGGFIYIATVSVIPELLEDTHFWQSVAEVVALLMGVSLMMVISWLEEMGHV